MKSFYISFVLFLSLFLGVSCGGHKNVDQDQRSIAIPAGIKKEIDHVFVDGKKSVVVYLLSKKDCAECTVSKIALWKNYSALINNSAIGLVLITNDAKGLKNLSRMNYLGVDLYKVLDSNNDFFQEDGNVKNSIPAAFVLDKEYTTLMEGNPIESSVTFDLFKKVAISD